MRKYQEPARYFDEKTKRLFPHLDNVRGPAMVGKASNSNNMAPQNTRLVEQWTSVEAPTSPKSPIVPVVTPELPISTFTKQARRRQLISQTKDVKRASKRSRKAYGIICMRMNPKTAMAEVLIVRRRLTYAFYSFIYGNYTPINTMMPRLLCAMNTAERLVMWSGNFDTIWSYMFLLGIHNEHYMVMRARFEYFFGTPEKVDNLRRLIVSHPPRTKIEANMWSFPKGKKNARESPLNCAMREFEEETGISANHFDIYPHIEHKQVHRTSNKLYKNRFYGAIISWENSLRAKIRWGHSGDDGGISEIVEMAWTPLHKIKDITRGNCELLDMARPIVRALKEHYVC